ncbi:Uncharacterized protein DAT39_009690, partial [Clarias magur]
MGTRSGGAALKGGRDLTALAAEILCGTNAEIERFSRIGSACGYTTAEQGECDVSALLLS